MTLLIDNYDSFVHNLARYIRKQGHETRVVRNDAINLRDIATMNPQAIVMSPGPGTPSDAGICTAAVHCYGYAVPMLGVCLGHQVIGEAYGGRTIRAPEPMHGRATPITHDGTGLFNGMPPSFKAGRYHSLITHLPIDAPLRVTARTPDGIVMAMQHETHPVFGVQFHPESILTDHGPDLLRNFFSMAQMWHSPRQVA